jgi:hypothetical protein
MNSNIELARPRDFGEIVTDTLTFTRQNFKPLLKYFFIFCGFFLVATAATSALTQIHMVSAINNFNPNSFESPFSRLFAILSPAYFLNLLFLVLNSVTMVVTVLSYMALYKHNGNQAPTTEQMWGYIKYFFFKALGSCIVMVILLMVGLVFCLIPGIYLYPVMALVLPIMVIENTSFGYAFNQSFRLIKNNWWLTFGALLVIIIIISVANMTVTIPASLISMGSFFFHLTKGTPVSVTAIVITAILQNFLYMLQIIPIIAACICYFSLTENKEGTGLMERINQFGAAQADADTATGEEY